MDGYSYFRWLRRKLAAGIKKEEGISVGKNVESVIEDFLQRLPSDYNMVKIMVNVKPLLDQTEGPFSLLLVQELTRMNVLHHTSANL